MSYNVHLEGFEGQQITVDISFWTGPKLLVNGQPAQKGPKPGTLVIQRNDGRQVIVAWKAQLLGLDVPQLVVDGKLVTLVKPLQWYQWLWGGWPIFLVFTGGALGAIAGMIAVTVNARVFRAEMNPVLKYAAVGGICLLALAAYYLAATLFYLLINR